ncbi:cold shock domain-containing protein [Kiloniella laminariae]|uniref:Cold shock domain-containing protein n=1 Tax=Kiloniella laminariae TaxID=454162 RepID=A0ABT4LEP7_9PROT|nr:cold shock domain-containing protein [Kiloniella laminariae]MCZ4279581.1 cold shock domain-containing protein [Kiloniella laminariae]
MNLDQASEHFETIKLEFSETASSTVTEEDVRFRLINRVLTEVLGWDFKEIQTEKPNRNGYSDYLIHSSGKTRAIVEAKRTSEELTSSQSSTLSFLKLDGPGLKNAKPGIKQATKYCIDEGIDFSVVTNGTTWIFFRATRTDGKKPSEGKAAVFNSLDVISENFQTFYEFLGREHLVNRVYHAILNEKEGFTLSPVEELHFAYGATASAVIQKSEHARDLEDVFDSFFSTISGDNDKELLKRCFVESKESQHAEKVLARITSEVLSQIQPMQTSAGSQLATEIEKATRTNRGEKVLLIGNKGSGKSTFVDRFFEMSLEKTVREKCLFLKLDLAEFGGDQNNLINWLDRSLVQKIETQLYADNAPTYEELQGIFHSTYQRWSVGAHKHLYEKDLSAFKIKFGEYLQDLMDTNPHEYSMCQLNNVVRSRHMLPCIVFDNTDQFSGQIQQAVFQYTNAIYERVKTCFLIVPITDQTVWQLSKSGPLQSYQAKSFFLPVPSTKEVLEKRIKYIAAEADDADQTKGHYTLPNGITVKLENLKAFASSLEEVFLNNEFLARRIGYLANFDIRRSLQLSKRLMTSPFIGIDDLIKNYISNDVLRITTKNLSLALVNGQYRFFRQEQSEFVSNLFSINPKNIGSPLLRLRILILLLDKQRSVHNPLESFLSCGEIEQYFVAMGVSSHLTRSSIQMLLDTRLVEPYDPTDNIATNGHLVSITNSGEMHIELALHDKTYFSQMALTTGIRNHELASTLKKFNEEKKHIEEIRVNFKEYCIKQDAIFIKIPASNENYKNQRSLVDELQAERRESGVNGTVKWFNPKEGYGFVKIDQKHQDAFLSLTVLEHFGLNTLTTNQKIVCGLSQSDRGLQVIDIEQVDGVNISEEATNEDEENLKTATVIFYDSNKGYGFLKPHDGSRDILIPRRTLNSYGLTELEEGKKVLVEIEMQIKGPVAMALALDD